jgi:aminopeptidase N
MREPTPRTIYLKDYSPPDFLIASVALDFDIRDAHTTVRASLAVKRNLAAAQRDAPLVLNGDELELVSLGIDGHALAAGAYAQDDEHLTIANVPDAFTLEVVNRIKPQENTKLEGLYGAATGLFTQCEAEGFRRITYFIDRPDVMARYAVTVHADASRYPVLLSNGNLVARGREADGRHWVKWVDPFPKPSYLFALVAARLDLLADSFVTRSGRRVALEIYVEPGKLDQTHHAMAALKKSMLWDERVFGLEVDVDCYMIVAVGDFNMGAMENKGLNIFNTKYVLARADTATDRDFEGIDRVVAHEYFHNWTGNRVTCRDWFQLSLKEGLTVFRDQEFGADHYSRAVTRIQEVRMLRSMQFAEDAGPMAHPVRPQSYLEISNFYTATVYEKGAEVVRMIHTLIGAEGFRKGMDLYFQRHDGQAVTTDEFAQAMQDASGVDLRQFKRWYDQAGTPTVAVEGIYDAQARTYTLRFKQSTPPTPGQTTKLPVLIPFAMGLVGADGKDVPLQPKDERTGGGTTRILSLTRAEEERVFVNVAQPVVPSLNRGFSAPVIVQYPYSDADLTHLMAHDSDPFSRWEAGQQLAANLILGGIAALQAGKAFSIPPAFIDAFSRVLAAGFEDPAFAAEVLTLPGEGYIAERMEIADPDLIHEVRVKVRHTLARALRKQLLETYQALQTSGPYSPDAASAGRRALRNFCLSALMELDEPVHRALCMRQFESAGNMTDVLAALAALANCDCPERSIALRLFYQQWKDEALVIDKWLAVQATASLPGTLAEVQRLLAHPAFELKNPNKVRALIGSFCHGNQVNFHAKDGMGYTFGADRIIEIDPINPQMAARLTRSFDRWRKFDAGRQAHSRAALERIRAAPGLSKDTLEVVSKSLT